MCFQINTITTTLKPRITHCRQCNPNNLRTLPMSANTRAVRYDDIYRMDEIKSLSFHIMFYRLYRGVAKYIISGNTLSSFE